MARILLVAHAYPDSGGIATIVDNYVAELENDHEVHLAMVEERPGRRDRLALGDERVHVLGYSNAMNPQLFPTSLVYAGAVGRALRRTVKRVNPAAVIVQDALNLPVPGLIATRGTPARLVVMDHGTLTNVHDRRWRRMMRRRLAGIKGPVFACGFLLDAPWRALRWRACVRGADQLWYAGDELGEWFLPAGGRAKEYAQTVPRDFNPATEEQRERARRELGLEQELTINVVGRLDGEKGLDTVIDALSMLGDELSGTAVLIAGDGSMRGWLADRVAELGLSGWVRLLGRLDRSQVQRLHHASDLHVFAGTIGSGVSISLLEAMACGVVPIASDVVETHRSLVGRAGWLFPAGDSAALRRALGEAMAQSSERRRELSEAAVRQVHLHSLPSVPDLLADLLIGGRYQQGAVD